MIGREDELRRMAQLVTTPGTGVAILAGEPGIGKTRLVQDLTRILPPDALVLAGQAEPGSLGRPFDGQVGPVPAATLAAQASKTRNPSKPSMATRAKSNRLIDVLAATIIPSNCR
jgi:hypothetical protein